MSMKENAIKYFKSGYSCSESIVKAASEERWKNSRSGMRA